MKRYYNSIILILLLLAIPVISSPDFDGTFSVFRSEPFQRDFIRFVLVILFFFINSLFFLPLLFSKKRKTIFFATVITYYALVVFVPFIIVPNHQGSHTEILRTEMRENRPPPNAVENMQSPPPRPQEMETMPPPQEMGSKKDNTLPKKIFTSILPFLFSFLSSFFIYRAIQQKELERMKAKAELLNLKYQLQPHFLFNILNSIYSLTLLKSDDAPNGVLKLSNVMRYVVQESSKDFVELEKEIAYLKDYIALQLIRTDSSLDFSYTEIGDLKNLKIAPFILVNFVENAFKYGFNAEENSKISVSIIVQEGVLQFKVFNSIVNHNVSEEESLKVGLKNTIEHMQHVYGENQNLNITDSEENYQVDLQLNLSVI